MASERQRQANRRNGLKGGPRTETGKQHSRLNSLRHGLTSSTLVVMPQEDQHEYEEVLRGFRESFNPNDAAEDALVLRLAQAHWRGLRSRHVETGILSITAATERARAQKIVEDCPETLSPHNAIAVAFMTRPADQWQTWLRYDTTISREFFRTLDALTKLQRGRQLRTTSDTPVLAVAAAGAQPAHHLEQTFAFAVSAVAATARNEPTHAEAAVSDSGIRSVSQNGPALPDLNELQKLTHESKQPTLGDSAFHHEYGRQSQPTPPFISNSPEQLAHRRAQDRLPSTAAI